MLHKLNLMHKKKEKIVPCAHAYVYFFRVATHQKDRGRRNLDKSIHNENHWPQLLHVSDVECQIDCFANFEAYFSCFSERKCISKSWRKLMNYKPENRIPWLFTDFDNSKDFPWLFKKFPDFSLTLKNFRFSLTFPWLWQPRSCNAFKENWGLINACSCMQHQANQ